MGLDACRRRCWVHLAKVLSQGYDDSSWPLQTKHGRHACEVRLIMHYSRANANSNVPSAPSYAAVGAPQVSMYTAPPPPSTMIYPPAATKAYPMPPTYPPQPIHFIILVPTKTLVLSRSIFIIVFEKSIFPIFKI